MKLPKFIYKKLKSHNTSLGDNLAFPPEEEYSFDYKIIKKRFNEVTEKIENSEYQNLSNEEILSELSKLISECKEKEKPIRENLVKICENTVYRMLDIPEGVVELKCDIVDKIQPNHAFRIIPEDSDNRDFDFEDLKDYDNMTTVVLKRRFINSLIQGVAYSYSSNMFYLNDVYQLNNELPNLYDKIRLLNDYLLFNAEEKISDKNPMQGACVEVELGREGEKTYINAQGLIFPYLLTETIRGFFELFASHGLPLDNKKATFIIKQSDFLLAEPWDLRFGVKLWEMIGGDIENTKILPYFFMNLCEMNVDEFNSSIKEILANTKYGKKIKSEMIDSAEHDYEFNGLVTTIQTKNDEKSVIEDQYMTEEEIDNYEVNEETDYTDLIANCSTDEIDFREEQINDYQFQMHVFINEVELPVWAVNLKAEPRFVNGNDLYQMHIFIDSKYQHLGLGYKIYKRFIELYGNIYSGNGRRMNNDEIISILRKLGKEPNIKLINVFNKNKQHIGYVAKLI